MPDELVGLVDSSEGGGASARILVDKPSEGNLREMIAVLSDTDLLTAHLAGRAEAGGGDVVDAVELAQLMRAARSSG